MDESRDRRALGASQIIEIERICANFEIAWKAGQAPSVRDYVPEARDEFRSEVLRELLFLDLEYRHRGGQRPTTAVYCDQFPNDLELIQSVLKESVRSSDPAQEFPTIVRKTPATPVAALQACRPGSKADDDARGLRLRLDVIAGPHQGHSYTFAGHDSFIVGRAKCAHFRLPRQDPFFSRIHLMIEVNPPCCRLFDMGSTNGTRVNGQRVQCVDLHNGDLVQGGDTVLKVAFLGDWQQLAETLPPIVLGRGSVPPPLPRKRERVGSGEVHMTPVTAPAGGASPEAGAQAAPRLEGYQLQRELGRGGMGTVYLALRERDRLPVAIKVIRPAVVRADKDVQLFLREAGILKELRHPHIVSFHEMGQAGEVLYFVMDYVDGANAKELVKSQGPLAIDKAVRLVCHALDGLHYAHQRGFVHRDVKPANLLVANTELGETCRLADFGLARAYQASSLSGLTMMGEIGGTLPFMPPEQITDYRGAQPAADQYSAAATLYYLLTGQYVFDFGDAPSHQQLVKILCEEPVPISRRRADVPQALAAAIHRALTKEPQDRFPDAAAFGAALLPFSA